MLADIVDSCRRSLLRNQSGVTFIEVLISVVVLALILASIPPVLLMITHSQFSWNEQRTAESISRNQVELIKVSQYRDDGNYTPITDHVIYETYKVVIDTKPIDKRLQEITIEIRHADRLVLTTMTYKVKRLEV